MSGRLEQQDNIWLKALVDGIDNATYAALVELASTLSQQGDKECADAVLEVVSGANFQQVEGWKEEPEMCPTLQKLFAPELALATEKAMAEGKAEGLAEGEAKGLAEGNAKGRAEGLAEGQKLLVEATQLLRNGETEETLRASGRFNDDTINKALLLK